MSTKLLSVAVILTAAALAPGQGPGKSPGGTTEGPKSLREAIERKKLEEENARLKTEVEALKKVQEEMHKVLVKTVTQIEADRILRDIKQRVEDATHERRLLDLKADHERRKKEVLQSPAILATLAPFTAHGYRQPKEPQGTMLAWERTVKKQPISYSRLTALGALGEGMDGLIMLNWIGGDQQDDRPRWRFGYQLYWTNTAHERIALASEYLRRYGDVLVELGYLSP